MLFQGLEKKLRRALQGVHVLDNVLAREAGS
jgi:hypothetical protein